MRKKPVGWIVLTMTHGRWCDDWDAEVHDTRAAGIAALGDARAAGEEAVLARLLLEDGALGGPTPNNEDHPSGTSAAPAPAGESGT